MLWTEPHITTKWAIFAKKRSRKIVIQNQISNWLIRVPCLFCCCRGIVLQESLNFHQWLWRLVIQIGMHVPCSLLGHEPVFVGKQLLLYAPIYRSMKLTRLSSECIKSTMHDESLIRKRASTWCLGLVFFFFLLVLPDGTHGTRPFPRICSSCLNHSTEVLSSWSWWWWWSCTPE